MNNTYCNNIENAKDKEDVKHEVDEIRGCCGSLENEQSKQIEACCTNIDNAETEEQIKEEVLKIRDCCS